MAEEKDKIEDLRFAAQALLREVGAPSWALTVAAWTEGGKDSLVVFVDPGYRASLQIPETFKGYPVEVRDRKPVRSSTPPTR